MYVLDFMGLAVLDPEFSRPMLPWVVREVIFRADPRQVQMTIKETIWNLLYSEYTYSYTSLILIFFLLLGMLPLKCNLIVHISLKDDQIEFHEIGESRKAEHAFHSDGYKIKGNGLIQTLFLEYRIVPEIQSDSSFLFDIIPFLDR